MLLRDILQNKADELILKYGDLAKDVVQQVLDVIKHEDKTMFTVIKSWESILEKIENNNVFICNKCDGYGVIMKDHDTQPVKCNCKNNE